MTAKKYAPGPKGNFILGAFYQFRADPIKFLIEAQHEYGDIVRLRFGHITMHLLSHPQYVKQVLQDHNKKYTKQTPGFRSLSLLLGNGLVTSEGDFWLRQRRIAQPAFHRKRIVTFVDTMVEATENMLARWQGQKQLNIASEMMHLTLDIVSKTLFSHELNDFKLEHYSKVINGYINQRIYRIFKLPTWFPTPENLRFLKCVKALDEQVFESIENKRQKPEDASLLSMLLHARDEETGEGMSDKQLRDEILTLMAAGHETSANALMWTWYLLANHPHVRDKLYSELEQVLGGRSPKLEDLDSLKYTKMVIREVMRLYPPAWIISRYAHEEDEIEGYLIPKGSVVLVSPYVTHHHPDFWPDPEKFDPQRFSEENIAQQLRFSYFPFGGGPRRCIGDNFALMEMQLIVATIAQRYHLELVKGQSVVLEPLITLHSKYKMMMNLCELLGK